MPVLNNVGGSAGDAAYQAYLEQIRVLRNSLTKSAGGAEEASGSQVNPETAKYYLKLKAYGTANVGAESVQKQVLDNKNDKYYKKIDTRTQEILDNSSIIIDGNNEPATSEYPFSNTQPEFLVPDNITNNVVPANTTQGEAVEKYFGAHNENNYEGPLGINNPFPKPGEDVAAQNDERGSLFADKADYKVGTNKGEITYLKSWATPAGKSDEATYGTPSQPYTEKLAATLEAIRQQTPGSFKFFIEKLHGKSPATNKWNKKGPIKKGLTSQDLPNRMCFPAYISTYNDDFSTSWSNYDFIGRAESVYAYQKTTRRLALKFHMLSDFSSDLLTNAMSDLQTVQQKVTTATSKAEGALNGISDKLKNTNINTNINPFDTSLTPHERFQEYLRLFPDWGTGTSPDYALTQDGDRTGFVPGQFSGTPEMLWYRMNFLAQCCYPWYRLDGKMKEQPFVRIRIGDYLDVIGIIDSLNYNSDEFDMDLNPSRVGEIPLALEVTMQITIVHEEEPSSTSYKFYHRKDYDIDDSIPNAAKENSKTNDENLDIKKSQSPVFDSFGSLTSAGKDNLKFPADVMAAQQSIGDFKGSIGDLKSSGLKANDVAKREKLKQALASAANLAAIKSLVDVSKIKNLRPDSKSKSVSDSPQSTTTAAPKKEKGNEPQSLFPQFKNPDNIV